MKKVLALGCFVLFAVALFAQAASVSVSVANDAWQVHNPANRTVSVVFATPQGVAFDGAFDVSPGGTMPVMGNTNQPFHWFACFTPYTPTDLGTGGTPNYNSSNVACR